jgi:hypothetical protein
MGANLETITQRTFLSFPVLGRLWEWLAYKELGKLQPPPVKEGSWIKKQEDDRILAPRRFSPARSIIILSEDREAIYGSADHDIAEIISASMPLSYSVHGKRQDGKNVILSRDGEVFGEPFEGEDIRYCGSDTIAFHNRDVYESMTKDGTRRTFPPTTKKVKRIYKTQEGSLTLVTALHPETGKEYDLLLRVDNIMYLCSLSSKFVDAADVGKKVGLIVKGKNGYSVYLDKKRMNVHFTAFQHGWNLADPNGEPLVAGVAAIKKEDKWRQHFGVFREDGSLYGDHYLPLVVGRDTDRYTVCTLTRTSSSPNGVCVLYERSGDNCLIELDKNGNWKIMKMNPGHVILTREIVSKQIEYAHECGYSSIQGVLHTPFLHELE